MNLLDIISLAKAGYKKSDIDELLKIQVDEPDQGQQTPESTEPETAPEGGADDRSPEKANDVPDYEALYKSLQEELDKVKTDLKAAQDINRNSNHGASGNEPDPWKDLEDIARGYM